MFLLLEYIICALAKKKYRHVILYVYGDKRSYAEFEIVCLLPIVHTQLYLPTNFYVGSLVYHATDLHRGLPPQPAPI